MSFSRPPLLDNEAERLARLRQLLVLDTSTEPVFDGIAHLASKVCGTPIALLSLVDAERQWFKAQVGLEGTKETPRELAFCAHAIADDALFTVPDARADARFQHNPLVTGAPDIRFYAGAPLVLPSGHRMGTLCVIDQQPRQLNGEQGAMLESLAALASQALQMRSDLIHRAISVRSEYEEALAASESRYRAIVEDQAEMISLARAGGELVYVNRAYARQFGLTPEQMTGQNLFAYVEPGDREEVRRLIHDVLEGGGSRSNENRALAPDGAERWVAWTNTRQLGAGGEPMLHSVGRDNTEKRRIEQALRASEDFLRRTGRVAGVGGWELVLATGALHWSEETRRIHGVDSDFVPTLEKAVAFYAPQARQSIEAAVRRAMVDGQPWDLELPFVSATGRALWVRAAGEVEFERGQPVRVLGAFQDITERKDLEQRVTDSERFVRQVSDNLPIRIAYIDRERRYRFVNRALLQHLGRPYDAIVGRTRAELVPEGDDTVFAERARAALAGEAQRFEFDEIIAGQPRRFENRLTPDCDAAGEVRGFFVAGVDITERTLADKAVRELAAILDNTPDFVVQADCRGEVLYVNPAARRALGMEAGEPIEGRSFAEFNTPATNRLFQQEINAAVKRHGVWVGETTVYLAGRREVPVNHMVIGHRNADGRIERYSAVMRDVSAEVQARHDIQRHTAVLRAMADAVPASVAVLDGGGHYRFVNRAFEQFSALSAAQVIGRHARDLISDAEYELRRSWIERAAQGETVSFELSDPRCESGRHVAITYVPLTSEPNVVDGFVAFTQDITAQRREESRLQDLAARDPLTQLLNRVGFERALAAMKNGPIGGVALLYIDLDHFKPVNDRYGHPVGDLVLQEFARRLLGLVRPTDAVSRLGGDEFAVALCGVRDLSNARTVAGKILNASKMPFRIDGLELFIGASVGLSFSASFPDDWQALIAHADAGLLAAKAGGRGRQAGATRPSLLNTVY